MSKHTSFKSIKLFIFLAFLAQIPYIFQRPPNRGLSGV